MNWAGTCVLVTLCCVAFVTMPWGLLILIPLLWVIAKS